MPEQPSFSVVVASFRRLDLLSECLESLRPQCAQHGAELILARADREPGAELARVAHGCRVIAAPAGAGVPELRGIGLAQAGGEWIAITEDHCVAAPDWLAALLAAPHREVEVLGGRMGNARRERGIDCGAFFAEYGFYGARPVKGAPLITQANAAYHRSLVSEVAEWARAGSWENVIHERLYLAGHRFQLVPGARIRQNLSYGLGAFCRDRFAHGRAYATTRAGSLSAVRRLLLFLGTPALPAVLALRIYRCVDPDERRYWMRGLPTMLLFLSAWALGEAAGYLRGAAR
ncbi:MAG TPA: glycosyltransferase [Gemmatimonadales bacterium]|nr:glycosyltransferase [Gemmatimonadales bacterium]